MTGETAPRFGWPREFRLRKRGEFLLVYEQGWRAPGKYFGAVCWKTGGETPSRVGFAVPKSVGGSVARNRVRRRLREAVRMNLGRLGPGWRVVIQGRKAAAEAPFPELAKEVERLFIRCARS